jgi:hypothetical protein
LFGRGLFRRALLALVLLALLGLVLDALTGGRLGSGGGQFVYVRRTPAIAAHTRAAQADAKPALPTARFPSRGIAGQAPTPSALPGPRPDTRPAPEVASHRVV